jgi:hypothetical protein
MLLTPSHSPLRAAIARQWAPIALASCLLFASQTSAFAQNGSYVKPTITVSEFFDDNLFMLPGAEPIADFVSRVSPGLEVGYRAPRGHLIGTYNFDAEIYPNHTQLNAPFVRQNAGVDLQYQVTPKVSFATLGSYDRTHTPYDLNLTGLNGLTGVIGGLPVSGVAGVPTGLALGRFEADQIAINPQVTAQVTGRTKAILGYRWLRDGFDNPAIPSPASSVAFSSWFSDASARVEHQMTGTSMFGVGYTLRQFGFGNGLSVRTQLFLLGVGHQFSPLTSIEIWAGPRIAPGQVRPEATVAFKHQFQRGEMTINAGQQQGTTLGALLPLDVQTVNLQIDARTSPRVTITFAPGYFHTTDGTSNLDMRVYAAGTALTVHLTPQLAIVGSYSYTQQTGTFATLDQTLHHSIALISFTVTPLRGVEF